GADEDAMASTGPGGHECRARSRDSASNISFADVWTVRSPGRGCGAKNAMARPPQSWPSKLLPFSMIRPGTKSRSTQWTYGEVDQCADSMPGRQSGLKLSWRSTKSGAFGR